MARKKTIWCNEQLFAKNLKGKTYIVTRANSGVGLETTRQLVKRGQMSSWLVADPQPGGSASGIFRVGG